LEGERGGEAARAADEIAQREERRMRKVDYRALESLALYEHFGGFEYIFGLLNKRSKII